MAPPHQRCPHPRHSRHRAAFTAVTVFAALRYGVGVSHSFVQLPLDRAQDLYRRGAVTSWLGSATVAATGALWFAPGLPANAEITKRMKLVPLPKAYRDALVAAASALKEALLAEEAAGDSFMAPEAEASLAKKEAEAGRLLRAYGENYISERKGLKADDPLRENPVFYFMAQAMEGFNTAVQSDKVPSARGVLIPKLQQILDLVDQAGLA
ncbi:unnamed protein product [Polarella glacialis]|uniref:Uncharacterized protein n=1 Tax=Polarella glacialis TaxID=89957 RepID=A0A813FE74_POLGL|nr:unnamed protein product [Polarella glacialis]CAE8644699.1 unnamed protein product [Polarella glacialis]|mmetsp:Transcript_12339/g.22198  ORF Transcript_12339/g.22198 Transcript_12339/m.22198 type:complete len:211 (-) Transcript_12339:101-733(-)